MLELRCPEKANLKTPQNVRIHIEYCQFDTLLFMIDGSCVLNRVSTWKKEQWIGFVCVFGFVFVLLVMTYN